MRDRRISIEHGDGLSVPDRSKVLAEPGLQRGNSDLLHGHIVTISSHICKRSGPAALRCQQSRDFVGFVEARAHECARPVEHPFELVAQPDEHGDEWLDLCRRRKTAADNLQPRRVRSLDAEQHDLAEPS